MSDTSPFGFGKFVPGFDFLQSLAKGASSSVPQMPSLSNWVAPTISVEELEKRIDELKAVQFWLEQNSRALTATIQALEVQKMTLATLKGMNFSMGDVANAFKLKTADTVMGGVQKAADSMSGAAEAMASAAARATGRNTAADSTPAQPAPSDSAESASSAAHEKSKNKAKTADDPQMVDPMQWWGALTSQFQQIAANALKDAAKQTSIDPTHNVATGLAKEAMKTATDMASQFAAKGIETMQAGQRAAAGAAKAPAAKKSAAKKAPAKSASKPAAKPAAKKATARRAPRKSAG